MKRNIKEKEYPGGTPVKRAKGTIQEDAPCA